jgi:HK97 family phage major capsid protein
MTLRDILARRDAARTELRAIHTANPDALPGDAQARWDVLTAEVATLDAQEHRQAALDDLDRRAAGQPIGGSGSGDSRFDEQAAQVTALDVIRAQTGATDAGAGRAREVSAELERRSGRKAEGLLFSMGLSGAPLERRTFTTATGAGSNLIQTTVSPNLIDRLRERLIVRQLGATVLGGLTGNLSIPRLSASASAAWIAEGGTITQSNPTLDAVSLTPKHVGGIVGMSRNMLQQSSQDVSRLVENDLAQLIAVALDQAALVGGGANQPSGLLAAGSGITTVSGGTNGAALTWQNIMALIAAVDTANALQTGGSVGFATNAKVVASARQILKTTVDTSSNFIMTAPDNLAGFPLMSSQNVPATTTKGSSVNLSALIFGDWSQLILGFWSELDILVNPFDSTAYAAGNVLVRAMATADVKLRHPLAFAALADVIA